MISATYFGEITELNSRAVWYSDEEDDDDDDENDDRQRESPSLELAKPLNHDTMRENITLAFKRVSTHNQQLKFNTCLISLASSAQYKHFKLNDSHLLGHFNSFGKAYAYPNQKGQQDGGYDNSTITTEQTTSTNGEEYLLWLLFDSTNQYISGPEVGYFVEALRGYLQNEFNLSNSCQLIILSKQYSTSEHLEYLNNFRNTPSMKLEQSPFVGRPLLPPSLIRNQFESALFEQLTLSLRPAFVVCLPNPKNFWFDKTMSWPSIPDQIIEHKLNDDSLEKTLIFT